MNEYKFESGNALYQNSSGGQLLKWKVKDRYIKTSTLDKQSIQPKFMYESYAEVIVSKLLGILEIPHVDYKLCKVIIDNSIETIACESVDFKPTGYIDISFGKLMLEGKIPKLMYGEIESYKYLIYCMKQYRINLQHYIDSIILIDFITLNDDRHYGNFGIMLGKNGAIKEQPIFDNGNSLFCHKHIEGINYSDDLADYLICKPFHTKFDNQLSLVDKIQISKEKLQLARSKVAYIVDSLEKYGLAKERCIFIKSLLRSRIDFILNTY